MRFNASRKRVRLDLSDGRGGVIVALRATSYLMEAVAIGRYKALGCCAS